MISTPLTLEQALAGLELPAPIRASLALLDLDFHDFSGARRRGQIVVHCDLAAELKAIFGEIEAAGFPIAQMVPVCAFGWSDDRSMAANNTSAFNYRPAVGKTVLSQHAYGRAVDINPMQNPYMKGELVLPPGAIYDAEARGALRAEGPVVAAFEKHGWVWGGRWETLKDWHHFEKQAGKS